MDKDGTIPGRKDRPSCPPKPTDVPIAGIRPVPVVADDDDDEDDDVDEEDEGI